VTAARTAPSRESTLEQALGDPWDPANPLGFATVLEADERAELPAEGVYLLERYGFLTEFVPAKLGGRLNTLDRLARVGRAVFRRDAALGLAYTGSFIGAVNVWTAGSPEQRTQLAELLLANRKVSVAYHELAHGNDFAGSELRARRDGTDRFVLTGRKELIANIDRAGMVVLLARTADGGGGRGHSLLALDTSELDPRRLRYLPRFHTAGMRGVPLGGVEFDACPVPARALLGEEGRAVDIALRSFQLTRIALPAMGLGILETGLLAAVRFSGTRRLFQRPVAAMPHVRSLLASAFLDLLICDCFTTLAARAVHLRPDEASVYAAAVKYFVPSRISAAMYQLSQVLGAQFYSRQGEYGIFQKMLRDLAPAVFGHAAPGVCLVTVLPQLPRLVRRSWTDPAAPPGELCDLDADLPGLPFGRLAVASQTDSLTAALSWATGQARTLGVPGLDVLLRAIDAEVVALGDAVRGLPVAALSVGASAETLALPARYAAVLAAGACLNIWLANRHRADRFLADPGWLLAALGRIAGLLHRAPRELSAPLAEGLHAELSRRFDLGAPIELSSMAGVMTSRSDPPRGRR